MSPKSETRVSEYFHLGCDQSELDFVDVDVRGDTPVFIDPRALRQLPTDWGHRCVSLVQDFFQRVVESLRSGRLEVARRLLSGLREPNQTHLGLSRGLARGHGMGPKYASDLLKALANSQVVNSGLLQDLEDAALLIEGVDTDIVSDITTNIIRAELIQYTQGACGTYGIPMKAAVPSGPLWNPLRGSWDGSTYVSLPVTEYGRLILVPKVIVRRKLELDQREYLRDYILEFLVERELKAGGELVQLLKNGSRRVTKKSVQEKYGTGKRLMAQITLENPELLAHYRAEKDRNPQLPMEHEEFSEVEEVEPPNWDGLLEEVIQVHAGNDGAKEYHQKVERLLTAVLYPSLTSPRMEQRLHDGRKRVDITYMNNARSGFFEWVGRHHPSSYIFVECKNYTADPANPELDQLSGRFSPQRGQVGILICRTLADRELFTKRCRDTALDQRGFIVALDDADLSKLVDFRRHRRTKELDELLQNYFERLVL